MSNELDDKIAKITERLVNNFVNFASENAKNEDELTEIITKFMPNFIGNIILRGSNDTGDIISKSSAFISMFTMWVREVIDRERAH